MMQAASQEQTMRLYRKCSAIEAYFTKQNLVVGGIKRELPPGTTKPTEEEVVQQVANNEGAVGLVSSLTSEKKEIYTEDDYKSWEEKNKTIKVKEFSVGNLFGGQGVSICVEIASKYLRQGSKLESEQGWVAYIGAPLKLSSEMSEINEDKDGEEQE